MIAKSLAFIAGLLLSTMFGMKLFAHATETDSRASLCYAMQLRTCNNETLRLAFAADDSRINELERALSDVQERLQALEAVSTAESRFKPESRKQPIAANAAN